MMKHVLFEKIGELLNMEFKKSFHGGELLLQESTALAVKLSKTGRYLCYSFDTGLGVFPFFNKSLPSLCSINDYVLFYPNDRGLYVFLIELKTDNTKGALEQLRAGFELACYLCRTAQRLLKYPEGLSIQFRGLVFSGRAPLPKGKTKPKNLGYKSDERNPELKYKYLRSGKTYNLDSLTH